MTQNNIQIELLETLPVCIGFSPEDIAQVVAEINPDFTGIDPDELAGVITQNVLNALREIDLATVVKDALAQCSGMDRDKWDAALAINNEDLFAEMLANGRNAEVLHD